MKKIFLLVSLLFAINTVFAQTLYTRKDSIPITQDSVTLSAGQFRGKLQWQRSLDGKTWNDLKGKTTQIVKVAQADEGFYRAKILEATCNPVYSDTAVVVAKKAVNANVTDPEKIVGATLVDRDNDVFTYVTSGTSTQTVSIPVNTVFVDSEKESDIRVVTSITQNGDTVKVNTNQGTMEDLFSNLELKLSTATMTPVTKSAYLTTSALAKAMKDEKGFIHPVEVIDNNIQQSSLKSAQATDESLPGIYFRKDFSGETIWEEGGASISFDQAYYQLGTELEYEFKFEQQGFDWANKQFPKGKITKFKICTNKEASGVEAKMVLKATTSHEFNKEDSKVIQKNVFNKTFKYLVFVAPSPIPIPFWATVKVDLMRGSSSTISGEASVTGGATGNFNLELGASYENGRWTTINPAFTPKFTLEGPEVDAAVNVKAQVEVYPHIEVSFYSVLSPYLDIAPYIRSEMEYSLLKNFKYDLYSGVNARLGIKADVFGSNIFDYNTGDLNMFEKSLYTAPKKLQVVSGSNQATTPGKALPSPVVIKVLDSKDKPVKNAMVNLKAKLGSLFKSILGTKSATITNGDNGELVLASDSTGHVSVNWVMAQTTAKDTLDAYLKDGTDTKIDSSSISVNTQSCGCDTTKFGHFTDPRDGHVYKTIKIGTQTWMAENLAWFPYITPTWPDPGYASPCYLVSKNGVLYDHPAALTAAPAGWHLPSAAEWETLSNYLGGAEVAGGKMKATYGWDSPNTGATNESCFSALPCASYVYYWDFSSIGGNCVWWSSTADDEYNVWSSAVNTNDTKLHMGQTYAGYWGHSVRCVKN